MTYSLLVAHPPVLTKMRRLVLGLLFALCLLPAAQAQAQERANTRKLFINIHALGARAGLDVDGFQNEDGRGAGIKLGYGFSKVFTLYLGLDVALNESINFPGNNAGQGYLDLGAQLNLTSGRSAFVPYVDVAATGRSAVLQTPEGDLTLTGFSGSAGGGLKLFLSPAIALDLNARLTRGTFSQITINGVTADISEVFGGNDIGSTAVGASLGLTFNPLR